MLAPPADLAERDLRAALARGWGIEAVSLTYRPVGFGSHHWDLLDASGRRWFVTVDVDDEHGEVRGRRVAALTAARQLRAAGHAFVVAPVATAAGAVAAGPDRFVVTLYPFVTGERFDFGDFSSDEHRRGIIDLLGRLHATEPVVVSGAGRTISRSRTATRSVAALEPDAWADSGPYASPAATLLATHSEAITRRLEEYDAMVDRAWTRADRLVVTHGEPHAGNTMRLGEDWVLIDWETLLLAPAERDLWRLGARPGELDGYTATTGVRPEPRLLDLYRRRWDLADLAVYVRGFRAQHPGDANDAAGWSEMQRLVEAIAVGGA